MKIRDILAQDKITISFEVFPPKTEDAYDSVERAAAEIATLKPDFMSITYGAGGGTSDYTVDIASTIKDTYGVTPLAHLTCVSSTKEKVHHVLDQLKEKGIEKVLASPGRYPKGRQNTGGISLCLGAYPGDQGFGRFLHRRSLLSGRPCGICQQIH